MARLVLGAKGEKWPCAIKMKLEKVLALSLPISFFPLPPSPVELHLSITHFDPLLSISCSASHSRLPTNPRRSSATDDPVWWPCVWQPRLLLPTSMEDTAGSVRLSNWNWKHPWQQRRIAVAMLFLVHKSRKQQHKILLTCSYGNGCLLPAGQPATKGPHLLSKGYCSACARRV